MPALQVRDFPDALYEDLREYAARHHRSMAQQTVDAVDCLIHGTAPAQTCGCTTPASFDLTSVRKLRIAKREEVFRRAAERRTQRQDGLPNPVEMLAQARDERDEQLEHVMAKVMEDAR
ncbi:MAG TPA: hypothetical protein OIM11_01250 [Coriobacteriaceae bacterium]|nr:hypothetical protein [Coriobacteriaceae bacterium]